MNKLTRSTIVSDDRMTHAYPVDAQDMKTRLN